MAKAHRYTGILGKRAGSVAWRLNERAMVEERLNALFRDFGLEPAHDLISLFKLLLKFAERHVAGFDRANARGPGNPGKGIDIDLILEFEKKTAGGKLSLPAAAPHVAKKLGRNKPVAALAAAYRREVKKLHPLEREAIDGMLRRELKTNSRRGK